MKLVKFLCILTYLSILPLCIFYGVVSQASFYVCTALWLLGVSIVLHIADKVLLASVSAREIRADGNRELFQLLKAAAYREGVSLPKIYLYDGNDRLLILESGREWSLLLSRSLYRRLSDDNSREFVEFVYRYKSSGHAWLQSKLIAVCVLSLLTMISIVSRLFFFDKNKNVLKVIIIFLALLMRPKIEILDKIARRKQYIKADFKLEALFSLSHKPDIINNYSVFLQNLFLAEKKLSWNILEYIEGFPVLENHKLVRKNEY